MVPNASVCLSQEGEGKSEPGVEVNVEESNVEEVVKRKVEEVLEKKVVEEVERKVVREVERNVVEEVERKVVEEVERNVVLHNGDRLVTAHCRLGEDIGMEQVG